MFKRVQQRRKAIAQRAACPPRGSGMKAAPELFGPKSHHSARLGDASACGGRNGALATHASRKRRSRSDDNDDNCEGFHRPPSIDAPARHRRCNCACSRTSNSTYRARDGKAGNAANGTPAYRLLGCRAAREFQRQGDDNSKDHTRTHGQTLWRKSSGSGTNWQELAHRSRKASRPSRPPTPDNEVTVRDLPNRKRSH
jgi:hypothetical protein